MLITPIKTPRLDYVPKFTDSAYSIVSRTDHWPYLKELGLESLAGAVEILTAWVQPKGYLPIHRDIDPRGIVVPWSIVICPTESAGLTLELYEPLDASLLETTGAPSGRHRVPSLTKTNARMLDSWSLDRGAALFNPGQYWHSASNSTDQWQNCVTIRSNHMSVLEKIKKIFDKN